ncbi:beta-1,3-galactosyltransferase 1 [Aplysia californica]|uniref:Hexosyltransferase n=1 Tax=Aplysia californica TaxID=6500 RepID=A0ABM0ZZD4_APLCA|nr:beta-1,3-galactosyltransferase 1 [Aplysia californica]XP_012937654.1 beta-1,3-galactosyltransferase 1 [Aplysia californica]
MALRTIRKMKLNLLVTVVVAVNVLFFFSMSYQGIGIFARRAQQAKYAQQNEHRIDVESGKTRESTPLPTQTVTTLSPVVRRKIQIIKEDLNDSSLTNDAYYPGKRVGKYIMVNPDLCRDANKIDVIIIVHTAPANLDKRQRIRDSFAKQSNFLPFQVRVAFLLGLTSNKTLERVLWFEHTTYNDTVMGNFKDDYHNLTLKGVMGYRWISEHCANSRFVLKIDDDVLINMYKLLYSFLNHMNGKRKSIFCNLWHKNTMPILRTGKWRVDPHVFSHKQTFPYDYCSGFVVIMTSDLMRPLYEAAQTTPFFWIDDVYLFGMLPSVVGGVTYYNYALDKNMTLNDKVAINCTTQQGPRCPIFATFISNQAYWPYWELIKGIYSPESWNVENKLVT